MTKEALGVIILDFFFDSMEFAISRSFGISISRFAAYL
jgi:hypothetical protein